jgi:hypothetical protein
MITARLLSRFCGYLKYRQALRELSGFSDRELDDLEIPRFVIKPSRVGPKPSRCSHYKYRTNRREHQHEV